MLTDPITDYLNRIRNALQADHEFLLKGGVFTEDVIETWIRYKRKDEADAIRLRPHPWEFARVWHLEPSLTDGDTAYAGVEDAALFKTTDGGASTRRTDSACGPRRPSAMPNSTRCPGFSAATPAGSAALRT